MKSIRPLVKKQLQLIKTMRCVLFSAAVASTAISTWAAEFHWTGAVNNYWTEPGNWELTSGKPGDRTTPTNDDAYFTDSGTYANNEIVFTNACVNSWATRVSNVGTAENPLVFRATTAANGYKFGNNSSNSAINQIGSNTSTGPTYLLLENGTWSTGAGTLMVGNSTTYTGWLKLTDGASLTVGNYFCLKNGEVTVENGTISVPNNDFELGQSGVATLNLNEGGVVGVKKVIRKANTNTVMFNGGELKALDNCTDLITSDANVIVKVGAKGGTINSNSRTVTFKRPIEQDGANDGGMRFIGGGTITLNGANTYTGGTTIELGTTVTTADATAKSAVLDNGLVVDGLKTFTDGDYTVFEYTGGTLTQADLDNVRLVNCAEGSDKAIVDDNKIVVGFTAGGLKKTTSTKVWSGKTLEQIKDANFTARMWGRSVSEEFRLTPDSAYGYNKKFDEDDGGSVTNIIVEFQIYNNQTKCVVVSFTNGVDGVYATALGADYVKGNNLGHDFCSNEDMSSTVAETYDSQSYGAFDLHVWLPIVVQAGETLFIDGNNYAPSIINHGTIVKTGDGTAAIPFDTSSKGVTIVSNGTLKVASKVGSGTDHTIRVADGATFDVNGTPLTLSVILEEGARFVNTGTGLGYKNAQTVQLTLEGDAYVGGNTFGIVGPSYAATSLDLGSHTLVIDMGDKEFSLVNTTIVGVGMIHVTSGRFSTRRDDSTGADCTISIGASGLFENNEHFTVSNFVNNGSIEYASSWGRGMLEVTGGFETKTASFPKLTLTGATVKATGAVATVLDTFSASGTVTIDASAITAQQLKDSADGRIAVLSVPSDANTSGADWKVSNEPIRDTRVKWVTNGDTKTLYLAKPNGLILVVR